MWQHWWANDIFPLNILERKNLICNIVSEKDIQISFNILFYCENKIAFKHRRLQNNEESSIFDFGLKHFYLYFKLSNYSVRFTKNSKV